VNNATSQSAIPCVGGFSNPFAMAIGSAMAAAVRTPRWISAPTLKEVKRTSKCA
jgi:hypothetical protein